MTDPLPPAEGGGSLATDLQVLATNRLVEALVASEQRMRQRIDLLAEVVFELDAAGRLAFLSRAWQRVMGGDPTPLMGTTLREHVVPADRAAFDALVTGVGGGAADARPVLRLRRADGGVVWAEVSLAALPAGGCVGALHDVTRQKRAQDELELLSLVASYTDNFVIITDALGRTEWVNEAFTRHTGYRLADMVGRPPGRVLQGPGTDPAEVARIADELRAGRSFRSEILNYTKHGTAYWTTMDVTPIVRADGPVQRYIAVQSDSTRLREIRQELREAKERAEAANEAKSQFLSNMSHEIRTPLNGVLGIAQLLQLPGLTEERRLQYADTILSSGQLLLGLLNDLLDLAKIEAGRMELAAGPFQPATLVNEVGALFAAPADLKRLDLRVAWLGPREDRVLGDAGRLLQVLNNLVSNAVKFTAAGTVRVEGRLLPGDGERAMLELSVTDTGVGIPADKLDLLFRPFSQLDATTSRRYGGSGLGLSIVRSLAALMGGTVEVRSTVGEGTTITVRVPVARVGEPAPPPARATPPLTRAVRDASAHLPSGALALVVEDSPANRLVLENFLRHLGMRFTSVEHGAAALAVLRGPERPAIVLMDCQMPVLDGFEATRAWRADEARDGTPRLPIIALTASAGPDDERRCREAGMDAVLTKPLQLAQLREAMARWLDREG